MSIGLQVAMLYLLLGSICLHPSFRMALLNKALDCLELLGEAPPKDNLSKRQDSVPDAYNAVVFILGWLPICGLILLTHFILTQSRE